MPAGGSALKKAHAGEGRGGDRGPLQMGPRTGLPEEDDDAQIPGSELFSRSS